MGLSKSKVTFEQNVPTDGPTKTMAMEIFTKGLHVNEEWL